MLVCSHVLCKVDSIADAVADFTTIGFTVTWGADPKRAHNALVWFDEGPFLELFELPVWMRALWPAMAPVRGRAAADRIVHWARPGEGFRDVALATAGPDLAAARAALTAAGLPVSPVLRGKRTRPDGQQVRYRFMAPRPARLPFVVSTYDPPQRPAHTVHPNGARRIGGVHLGVAGRDRVAYDVLAGSGRWLTPVAGSAGVLRVEVEGLRAAPDPSRAHGTVLVPG